MRMKNIPRENIDFPLKINFTGISKELIERNNICEKLNVRLKLGKIITTVVWFEKILFHEIIIN